jgi:hypothetical protein
MDSQDRIMDGDLQTLGLQSILKMLTLSGKTGVLLVQSGPESLSVSLKKGQVVLAREEGLPQPDLPGMLGLLGRLDSSRVHMIRELSQGDNQIAMSMLVERGWMTTGEMQRRLEFAVTQAISHALRWVNGHFAFHRLVPIDSGMRPLDVDSVLLEALRQADEWEEFVNEGMTQINRTTVARWLPEVSRDVRSMGLSQETIEVLCLSNGEIPLQTIAQVLMQPEARVARVMAQLVELRLIEVVDTALETELQRDLSNIIIKSQHSLAFQQNLTTAEQHLLGLVATLCACINGILLHHRHYARAFRGRGAVSSTEVTRYMENRFGQPLQRLAQQSYPILETTTFAQGQLDCNDILTLNKVVKGEQLEEFYWDAVQGLSAYLRMIFEQALRDEVGNSHTGRQLYTAWKMFLSEIDQEIQRYQVYRAYRNVQSSRGREIATQQTPPMGLLSNQPVTSRGDATGQETPIPWSSDTQRRFI